MRPDQVFDTNSHTRRITQMRPKWPTRWPGPRNRLEYWAKAAAYLASNVGLS
jgi:hypothetical protein